MSNISEEWVVYYAPVRTQTEKLVLLALAHRTDDDGCDGYKSKPTLAQAAMCDPKTVQRTLNDLKGRGVIKFGDQAVAAYIDVRYRPKVYDIQIPYSWFSAAQMAQVNEERARKGRLPLRPEDRPDLAPAPERVARSDKGTKVPQRRPHSLGPREEAEEGSETRGDSESPLPETPRGDSESQSGGITKDSRGDSESPNSLKQLPGFNSSSFPDSFANAQESAGSAPQQETLGGMPAPTASGKKPSPKSTDEEETGSPQTRDEALPAAKKLADGWLSYLKGKGVTVIDRSRKAEAGKTGSRPFWTLVDGLFAPALIAGADELEIKTAMLAAFTASGNTIPPWAIFERHLHVAQGNRSTAGQTGYGKPRTRVHIDNVPQEERDYAAAAFGETPKTGASW